MRLWIAPSPPTCGMTRHELGNWPLSPPLREEQQLRDLISTFTSRLNELLYQAGEFCFDEHTLADLDDRVGLGTGGSYTIMASCPGNPLTTFEDIDSAVKELVRSAQSLAQPMTNALRRGNSEVAKRRVAGPAGWADE
jgi:hypothetical protein